MTYIDLDAKNPSRIDGQLIEAFTPVHVTSDTDIRLGELRLHLHREPVAQVDRSLYRRGRDSAFAGTSIGDDEQTLAAAGNQDVVKHAVAALRGAARQGDPLLEAYRTQREATEMLLQVVRAELHSRPLHERERHMHALIARMPTLAGEASFRACVAELGVDPVRVGLVDLERWFGRLTRDTLPVLGATNNLALALERVGEVLELFGTAFIELSSARRELDSRLKRPIQDNDSILERIEESHGLLTYLLSPDRAGSSRVDELGRALAKLTLHHATSLGAVVDAARELVDNVRPLRLRAVRPARESKGVLSKIWPRGLQREALERHEALVQRERFEQELFCAAAARMNAVGRGSDV